MRSLFLRIFLSFWAAMTLGGLGLLAATALTQPEPFAEYVTGEQSAEDTRDALAIRRWPRSSKKRRNVSRISREGSDMANLTFVGRPRL